jgi:hypothetical protein
MPSSPLTSSLSAFCLLPETDGCSWREANHVLAVTSNPQHYLKQADNNGAEKGG